MLRRGVKPYLFVINNEGYEIERQIHGWTAEYNEIQQYNHQLLLPFLAGTKSKVGRVGPVRSQGTSDRAVREHCVLTCAIT
jgi:TPP-dependent 2-oxoacid decarboxylase